MFTDFNLNSNTNYTYNARAGNDSGTSGTVTRSISTQAIVPQVPNFLYLLPRVLQVQGIILRIDYNYTNRTGESYEIEWANSNVDAWYTDNNWLFCQYKIM